MKHRREIISAFLLTILFPATKCVFFTTVVTRLGTINGFKSDSKVVRFSGIPYGKPPLGDLRFSKPVPYGSWNNILDATRFPPSCMQFSNPNFKYLPTKEVSEDCLFLNIYAPLDTKTRNKRRSVMVWIHGGGFIGGQASGYDGSDIASIGDVIVVTVNYRLGIFGFLSSGDSIAPGNYGLWDQRLAIKWVKDNIAEFGGDPSSITLFGSTAGAMCANLQAISPLNKGLFQRAIFQSGNALSKLSLTKPNNLKYFGTLHNCTFANFAEIVSCLRQKSANDLIQTSIAFNSGSTTVKLGPVIDGDLIPHDPKHLLDKTSSSFELLRSLDIIVGTTNADGSVLVGRADPFKLNTTNGMTSSDLCDVISPSVTKAICDEYKALDEEEQGRQIVNMYTDFYFVNPALELLNIHSNKNSATKSYQYSFEYDLPSTSKPAWLKGVVHGAESKFVFGLEEWEEKRNVSIVTLEDLMLSTDIVRYWTSFAKTGNPVVVNFTPWPEFKYSEKKYLEFGVDKQIREKTMLNSERMKFWFNLNGMKYMDVSSATPLRSLPVSMILVITCRLLL